MLYVKYNVKQHCCLLEAQNLGLTRSRDVIIITIILTEVIHSAAADKRGYADHVNTAQVCDNVLDTQ